MSETVPARALPPSAESLLGTSTQVASTPPAQGEVSGDISAAVTAWATVALVAATIALAWLTWILARATSRATVMVTIEPNPAAINFLDMHIINEGNASAFDVQIRFDPPLPEKGGQFDQIRFPSRISTLSAGQRLVTSLCEAFVIIDQHYVVIVSWRTSPRAWRRQSLQYPFDLTHVASFGTLGKNPAIQTADELKKIRESIDKLVSGQRRLRVDQYSQSDRMRERREVAEQHAALRSNPPSFVPKEQEGKSLYTLQSVLQTVIRWFKGT